MKKVLLTGAAGFLGKHIGRHFAQLGWKVAGVDILAPGSVQLAAEVRYEQCVLPSPDFERILRDLQPDVCIHCAGRASVPMSMSDPAADFRDNTILTFELLDAIRRNTPGCRFILLSSAAVYGNPRALPVSENTHVAPLSPYGFHKRQCELICQEFAKIYGVPTISTRIFSAYGPGLRRQVVWDICERLLTKGSLSLSGTGQESRDFIHATDIARALALLADKAPANGEIYNLSAGRETTIAELASLLISAMGMGVEAQFDGRSRPGDPLNWRADVSKLRELGFEPAVSLEKGLADVAAWARLELGSTI